MEKKHYYNIEARRFNALTFRIFRQVAADVTGDEGKQENDHKKKVFNLQDEVLDRMIDPIYIANELRQMDIEKENEQ